MGLEVDIDSIDNRDKDEVKESQTSQNVTSRKPLTPRQNAVLEALMVRGATETLEDVATKIGITRQTIYRYMRDNRFAQAYREAVDTYLAVHRGIVASSLVEGAITPGRGQAALQKLYWQKLGEAGIDMKSLAVDSRDPREIIAEVLGIDVKDIPE